MEMTYDRLAKQASSVFQSMQPSLFAGVGELPMPAKSIKRFVASQVPQGDAVSHLLAKASAESVPRIVGIDLTGSEKRATGWALMEGAQASTKCLRTDEELIEATVEAKPDLVSIDSPLSLPEGWNMQRRKKDVPIYRVGLKTHGYLRVLVPATHNERAHSERNETGHPTPRSRTEGD
jgi:hypothetical protein